MGRARAHSPLWAHSFTGWPHSIPPGPFVLPPRDHQHDPTDISLPPNFAKAPSNAQPLKTRLMKEFYARHGHSGLPAKTEADWLRLIANYWGLCSLVDTYCGSILDAVEEYGLRGKDRACSVPGSPELEKPQTERTAVFARTRQWISQVCGRHGGEWDSIYLL